MADYVVPSCPHACGGEPAALDAWLTQGATAQTHME